VILYDEDGDEVARTVTDVTGYYEFPQIPAGDYSV
jgi:hypothetical protein